MKAGIERGQAIGQGRSPRRLCLGAIGILLLAGSAFACKVPVFRFALDRWEGSDYVLKTGGEVAAGPANLKIDSKGDAWYTGNRNALFERTAETLGLHYAMRWPRQELETARPLRTSPLYDLLAAKGAEFGTKNGWERANYFKPDGVARPDYTLGMPGWLPWVIAEQKATREAVALYERALTLAPDKAVLHCNLASLRQILGEPEGIERLGGIDFDEAVFHYVVEMVGPALHELDPDEPGTVAAM